MHRGRMPAAWAEDLSDDYEWIPLRLPPEVTRLTASIRLSIEAEYRGWELTRVRLYTDGSRRVLLRRRKIRTGDATGNVPGAGETTGQVPDRLAPEQPSM